MFSFPSIIKEVVEDLRTVPGVAAPMAVRL